MLPGTHVSFTSRCGLLHCRLDFGSVSCCRAHATTPTSLTKYPCDSCVRACLSVCLSVALCLSLSLSVALSLCLFPPSLSFPLSLFLSLCLSSLRLSLFALAAQDSRVCLFAHAPSPASAPPQEGRFSGMAKPSTATQKGATPSSSSSSSSSSSFAASMTGIDMSLSAFPTPDPTQLQTYQPTLERDVGVRLVRPSHIASLMRQLPPPTDYDVRDQCDVSCVCLSVCVCYFTCVRVWFFCCWPSHLFTPSRPPESCVGFAE